MDIAQIGIMIFGALAIWFVGRKEKWRRWGYILGLVGQPFWIYTCLVNEHWGILIMTLFYTYSWGQGIYNYWLKKDAISLQNNNEVHEFKDFKELKKALIGFESSKVYEVRVGDFKMVARGRILRDYLAGFIF